MPLLRPGQLTVPARSQTPLCRPGCWVPLSLGNPSILGLEELPERGLGMRSVTRPPRSPPYLTRPPTSSAQEGGEGEGNECKPCRRLAPGSVSFTVPGMSVKTSALPGYSLRTEPQRRSRSRRPARARLPPCFRAGGGGRDWGGAPGFTPRVLGSRQPGSWRTPYARRCAEGFVRLGGLGSPRGAPSGLCCGDGPHLQRSDSGSCCFQNLPKPQGTC